VDPGGGVREHLAVEQVIIRAPAQFPDPAARAGDQQFLGDQLFEIVIVEELLITSAGRRIWKLRGRADNHLLDCEVLAHAAAWIHQAKTRPTTTTAAGARADARPGRRRLCAAPRRAPVDPAAPLKFNRPVTTGAHV
jgi:phage terminase large subunit GpA-like protein